MMVSSSSFVKTEREVFIIIYFFFMWETRHWLFIFIFCLFFFYIKRFSPKKCIGYQMQVVALIMIIALCLKRKIREKDCARMKHKK